MRVQRVLLVDSSQYWPSNPLFVEALEEVGARRGWEWACLDEQRHLASDSGLPARVGHRIGRRRPGIRRFNRAFTRMARELRPDLVLVVKGAYLLPEALEEVKRSSNAVLANYATDDPFNPRASTAELRAAIPLYDLYACTKRAIMDDVSRAGAGHVSYLPFAYKPAVHFPEAPTSPAERQRFEAEVAFIGGADDDRAQFLEALLDGLPGVRLALWGGYWSRHRRLRSCWRGIARGRDYRLAISSAGVVVNLVRRANRDGHVMRTFEVPACGGCMLTERTAEHEALFKEELETRFFVTPDELAHQVEGLLGCPSTRRTLAERARHWAVSGPHTYTDRLCDLVDQVESLT
jgi:spore maturation protein CgeB